MTRGEAAGLTLAVAGHVALFLLLSATFLADDTKKLESNPIEVALVDEVGLVSTAPVPSTEEPAARLSPVEAPIEPDSAPPQPAEKPEAESKPTPPKPAPAPAAKPEKPSKPAPSAPAAKPPAKRVTAPTGRLDGIVAGLSDRATASKSTKPPAAVAGAAAQSSINAEIRRQLKPHWRSPTGSDVELLRTVIELRLNRDGSLAAEPRVAAQTGLNDSNRGYAHLHAEAAIKAIKLAAPFKNLPPEYYDYWKRTGPAFDRRLSQ